LEDNITKSQLDIDLSILDNEFNLEMMFDDDADEQVVSEIEKLIEEDVDPNVPDAEVPDA